MKQVRGGVGDFLQIIDQALLEDKIIACTHFCGAKEFFEQIGINAEIRDLNDVDPDVPFFEYKKYQDFRTPITSLDCLYKRGDYFGIHPVGSSFSNSVYSASGLPTKIMPVSFVQRMIDAFPDRPFRIFGTKNELEVYKENLATNDYSIDYCSFGSIWDSFYATHSCSTILAVDSSIKSYAAIRKFPCFVMLGEYEDEYRDKNFIDYYVEDGVMKTIPFTKMNKDKAEEVIKIIGEDKYGLHSLRRWVK